MKTHALKTLVFGFAALFMAAGLHAQTMTITGGNRTVYTDSTTTFQDVVRLTEWNDSNVWVRATTSPSRLVSATVDPTLAITENANRDLIVIAGSEAGTAQTLTLTASEYPDAVNTRTGSITVTVREFPSVSFSTTTGLHNAHIDAGTPASVTVTPNETTTLYREHFTEPSSPTGVTVTRNANTFTLQTTTDAPSGSVRLYVVYRDNHALGGVCTNSINFDVVAVPRVTNLAGFSFKEDTLGSEAFTVTFGDDHRDLVYDATFVPDYIIESYEVTEAGAAKTLRLSPYTNAFGAVDMTLITTGNGHAATNTIRITVIPVPDPPEITGLPTEVIISNKDPWTNVFANVVITDVDDFPPGAPLVEVLDVTVMNAMMDVVFGYAGNFYEESTITNPGRRTDAQTTWLSGVSLKALEGLFDTINTTNYSDVVVTLAGVDKETTTVTFRVGVWFENTPPEFTVGLSAAAVEEGKVAKPFNIATLVDPDVDQTYSLVVRMTPETEQYGYFQVSGQRLTEVVYTNAANRADLNISLINLEFVAHDGVMTNALEDLVFVFELSDGYDTTTLETTLGLVQLERAPSVHLGTGAQVLYDLYSDDPQVYLPFRAATVADPDEGGTQPVRMAISAVPAYVKLNGLSTATGFMTPADATDWLRQVSFEMDPDALSGVSIGSQVTMTLVVTATDETGRQGTSTPVTIKIEKVNAAPLLGVPPEQPLLFSPLEPIRPFADITLVNDDDYDVTFTFEMDNPAKGSFGNIDINNPAVSQYGDGYKIVAPYMDVLAIATNVTFTLAAYPFPLDDPGGTLFTLEAQDWRFYSTKKTIAIQVQEPPRNWMVTNPLDDGRPGSLTHALENFGNNDVITFALPDYPATIRLPNAAPVTADKVVTIKGPGADLLTISGDVTGNGLPDRQFLKVIAPVTVEGLTIADCTADYGGAFSVTGDEGRLTLRQVILRDCYATECGGAIDVENGALTVESCVFMENISLGNVGSGGGAITLCTWQDTFIENSLFVRNYQANVNSTGGGAICAMYNGGYGGFLDVTVTHCTFTGNLDESRTFNGLLQATSIMAYDACTFFLQNNIFEDDTEIRTLHSGASGEFDSLGGNVCNNAATSFYNQVGSNPDKNILEDAIDQLHTAAQLDADFVPANPAVTNVASALTVEQTGRIRGYRSRPGAFDPGAAAFPAITEIQLSEGIGAGDRFIEIYAPRGNGAVNLEGMRLLVNGTPVHVFGEGLIAADNNGYTIGSPAADVAGSYQFEPGCGVVIVFPAGAEAVFQDTFSVDNPTPVVRGSVVDNAADFAVLLSGTGRGSVTILDQDGGVVVQHTFLTVYNDPASPDGADMIDTGVQSIATVPQARGYAFLPHDFATDESPGMTSELEPFGGGNALPVVKDDIAATTEDDTVLIDVLANDHDPDGDVMLIVFGSTSAQGATITYDDGTGMLLYDPTERNPIQALPAGGQLLDTFWYTVTDGPVLRFTPADTNCISLAIVAHDMNFTVELANVSISNELASLNNGDKFWLNFGDSLDNWEECKVAVDSDFEGQRITLAIPLGTPGITKVPALIGKAICPSPPVSGKVTVTVEGLNDNPVGGNDPLLATLTEREAVRILAHPGLAHAGLDFGSYPEHPVPGASLLANDTDIDEGDVFDDFRVIGVLSDADVHPVTALAPSADGVATLVTSPGHGLATGTSVIMVGVANPARVNGSRVATVVDEDTFSIPVMPGVVKFTNACWIPSTNTLAAVTPLGASVSLATRADPQEDSVIYNAAVSAPLQALAVGESCVDGFWYVFTDVHNAPAIAYVSLTVTGVNDPPEPSPDPPGLEDLEDEFGGDIADILTNRLAILTVLVPPASGADGLADLVVADKDKASLATSDLTLLADFYSTDEDTPLTIYASDLFANDSDIDTNDTASARHFIVSAEPMSLRGAAINVNPAGMDVIYDPRPSTELQGLGIDEAVFDLFTVHVSDGHDAAPSLVAVLVRGVNDKPVAYPVWVFTNSNPDRVTFPPDVRDPDVNDIFPPFLTVDVDDPSLATNRIPYTVTDHSLFLALDDTFRVEFNAVNDVLDVLANDVNFHGTGIRITSVTPSLRGGTVAPDATGSALLYTPPADFAGDDLFTYSAVNELGVVRKANVRVRVIRNGYNGLLLACDDEYAVARNMTFSFDPRVNDVVLPGSTDDILVDPAYTTDWPDGLRFDDPGFTYTATTTSNQVSFTYRVTNTGNDAADSYASVTIKIIDRFTGIQPDYFTAAPGAAPVALDLFANDVILGDSYEGMKITGVDTNGTAGVVDVAPDGSGLTYAAPAGFLGVDSFLYTAVDRYGAQGTTNVFIKVGAPLFVPDTLSVATNTTTLVDVLANDSIRPYAPPVSFELLDVFPAPGTTPNGAASVSNNLVRFEAGLDVNAAADWLYTFAVPNASVITGTLHVTTREVGMLYANPDHVYIFANTAGIAIEPLANDISCNRNSFPLSLVDVQTTMLQGTATRSGNTVYFTPNPGTIETCTIAYQVSDGVVVESGQITIEILPGDLVANNDAYLIGYEWDGTEGVNAAEAYELPVLGNDAVFPGGGALTISGFGIGANAPQYGSTLAVSEDGQSIIIRPGAYPLEPRFAPSNQYVEVFSYEIEDTFGRKAAAQVAVTVKMRTAAVEMETQDDVFVVERNSVDNILDVLANDLVEPKTPLAALGIYASVSAQYGNISVSMDGKHLVYSPPPGFIGTDYLSYTISDGLGGDGTGHVTIHVGALPVVNDSYAVLFGSTNILDVILNDPVSTDYAGSYSNALYNVFEASTNGFIDITDGKVLYIPDPVYRGPDAYPYVETFRYTVVDKGFRLTDATVTITVYDLASSLASSHVYVVNADGSGSNIASLRDEWYDKNFTAEQTAAGFAGPGEDPDGDGLTNDQEYAFGGDPWDDTNGGDPTIGYIFITVNADYSIDIYYTRRDNDPDLVFVLQGCENLDSGGWVDLTPPFRRDDHPNDELIIATHLLDNTTTCRFFRVAVILE